MPEAVDFARFARALRRMGFRQASGPGVHVFEHAPTDTAVLLPPLRADQRVPAAHLISARKVIEDRGVATAEEFDRLLTGRGNGQASRKRSGSATAHR